MPRTKEFNPTEVLDKAMHLFWEKGYNDTSIRDVANATGVSHAGLYSTYGSKQELFVKAFDRYCDLYGHHMYTILNTPDASRPEIEVFFKQLPELAREEIIQYGCFLCNSATEVAQTEPIIAERIHRYFDEKSNIFLAALKRAQAKGEISHNKNIHVIADFFIASLFSLSTMERSQFNEEKIKNVIHAILIILE